MTSRITQLRLEGLKRRAARLKRADAITHAQALDRVAQDEGFTNWSQLARAVEQPSNAVTPAPSAPAKNHEVRLSGFVRANRGDPGHVFHEFVPSLHPAKHYAKLAPGRTYWQDISGTNEGGVRESIATLRRGIEFMDATGLRRSEAWRRVFGRDYRTEGFDHTYVWMDRQRQYLVSTEPYIGSRKAADVLAWCGARGWRATHLPQRVGIWNPCRKDCPADCTVHTTMVLMAPPRRGADLDAAVSALLAARV